MTFWVQYGFRKTHSTIHALMEAVDSIDNHENLYGIHMDLEKAFDTVNHAILLPKLYHYRIRGIVFEWFKSYLNNRSQYI